MELNQVKDPLRHTIPGLQTHEMNTNIPSKILPKDPINYLTYSFCLMNGGVEGQMHNEFSVV